MFVITKSYHELIIFSRVHKQTILTDLLLLLAPGWVYTSCAIWSRGKETVRMDKVNVHPYTIKIPAWLNTVLGFFYGWTCQL